jgi:uncharacterized protein YuzE
MSKQDTEIFYYEEEDDLLYIQPAFAEFEESKWAECKNVAGEGVIVDLDDQKRVRSIEILHSSRLFKTTAEKLTHAEIPFIQYNYYPNGKNVLDIIFEDIGGIRAEWDDEFFRSSEKVSFIGDQSFNVPP